MLDQVDLEVIGTLFRIEVKFEAPQPGTRPAVEGRAIHAAPAAIGTTSTSGMAPPPTAAQAETRRQMDQASKSGPAADTGYRSRDKKKTPGPNDLCHCGSGK